MKDQRKNFKNERLTIEQMETLLQSLKKRNKITVLSKDFCKLKNEIGRQEGLYVGDGQVFISDLQAETAVYYSRGGQLVCSFVCKEDYANDIYYDYVSTNFSSTNGAEAWRILKKYYDLPVINEFGKAPLSAYQLTYKNEKYIGKKVDKAICYDRNSSFTSEQRRRFCDFVDLGRGPVEKGQFGINDTDMCLGSDVDFLPVDVGQVSDHRFRLIDNVPERIIDFVDNWYKKKKEAKTIEEKRKAKSVLNLAIGVCQNKNWVYRALIVAYSNAFIASLRDVLNDKYDDCVIYCNTDSIAVDLSKFGAGVCHELESLKGDGLGQMKVEHSGSVTISDTAYQWTGCLPMWSGRRKETFRRFARIYGHDFDLSNDDDIRLLKTIKTATTRWSFDKETLSFVNNEE